MTGDMSAAIGPDSKDRPSHTTASAQRERLGNRAGAQLARLHTYLSRTTFNSSQITPHDAASAIPKWNFITYASVTISIIIGLAMLATIVPTLRVFPVVDEPVYIEPIASGSFHKILKFIFSAHGDHRIPIQKAYQTVLLKWSGMDFGVLITANIPLMVAFSVLLTLFCLECRKKSLVGDLFIPFLALPFTASFLYIGFNVNFLHAVFLVVLASYFFVRYQNEKRPGLLYLGLLSLLICATVGLPGAVFALVSTIITGTGLLYFEQLQRRKTVYCWLAAIAAMSLLQAILWAAGPHPITAHQPIGMILSLYYNMAGSSLLRYARPGYLWKGGIIICLALTALAVLVRAALQRRLSFIDIAIAAPLLGSFAVISTVAKGRGFEEWSARFDHHYGYLTILIPITSWLIISTKAPKIASQILGIGLIVFFGLAFKFNLAQRMADLQAEGPGYRAAQRDFASSMPSAELVKKYPLLRSNADLPQPEFDKLARDIDTLRRIGGWRYRDGP